MKNKFVLLLLFFILIVALPRQTSAFGWFGQKKTETAVVTTTPQALSESEKTNVATKYKLWFDAFEKKNVEAVITNQNKFVFTILEINYLLETESKNVKNPSLTGASITSSNGNINVAVIFHKFISGRFSFVAKVILVENKIRLQLSYVKIYGISIPTSWLEGPVNTAMDEYFSFLYNDSRYKGFTFIAQDNLLQLKPNF